MITFAEFINRRVLDEAPGDEDEVDSNEPTSSEPNDKPIVDEPSFNSPSTDEPDEDFSEYEETPEDIANEIEDEQIEQEKVPNNIQIPKEGNSIKTKLLIMLNQCDNDISDENINDLTSRLNLAKNMVYQNYLDDIIQLKLYSRTKILTYLEQLIMSIPYSTLEEIRTQIISIENKIEFL